jgi:Flp pilus assembly protein TadG
MMTALIAMLAFAIDLGYLLLARDELQRSADSAALAAAWELVDESTSTGTEVYSSLNTNARAAASQFAFGNAVLHNGPTLADQDVTVGYLSNFHDPNIPIDTSGTHAPNAVRVMIRKTADQNGRVPFFLAHILGVNSAIAQSEATAAVVTGFDGFRAPSNGDNLDLLPFALDVDTWNALLSGVGTDNWRWNTETGQVVAGSDGILEANLYPQGTGAPGNRGTVDIGGSNNSTADIARQIVEGVSPADLEHHGGELKLDESGELPLNGDTGISAGVKDELASIIGKPRVVPVFSCVEGPGNNAMFTITCFAGIRIMEVRLTGSMSSKRVIIQPAPIVMRGGIPSSNPSTSNFVYSPAFIAR